MRGHTPGPWIVADDGLEISVDGSDDDGNVITGWKIISSPDYAFAAIACDVGSPNCWDDEGLDANACLIATAPELLAALLWLHKGEGQPVDVAAVIAKATNATA